MSNTHQALLINRDGTDAQILAYGTRKFCKAHAERWIDEQGLGDMETVTIVKVIASTR